MRVSRIILFIFTLALIMSGCRSINVSPYDEMIYSHWCVSNQSKVTAELYFDTENHIAHLKIQHNESLLSDISGTFAVDNKSLYIFSEDLMQEFSFDYTVYADRLELEYKGNIITFYAKN